MKPRVRPLLRPTQVFRTTCPEPTAADYACDLCGEWLNEDGECDECDSEDE